MQQLGAVMGRLNELTWAIAMGRGWVITLAVWAGIMWQWARALRRSIWPALSACIHSGAVMLQGSAAVVTVCTLLHFADLRWLAPGTAPGGLLGDLAGPFTAAKVSIHTALVFAAFAMAGYLVARLSRGPARRAAERALVRVQVAEQVRPLEARLRVVEGLLLAASRERGDLEASPAPHRRQVTAGSRPAAPPAWPGSGAGTDLRPFAGRAQEGEQS